MRPNLLVCPGCRVVEPGRIALRTLEPGRDFLTCACGRRYPVVDRVPLLAPAYDLGEVVERDLPPEVAGALALAASDDAPYARLLDHLSVYMDAHWADHAEPPLPLALAAIVDRIAQLPHVPLAVELGCSAGRIVAELAARADHVVGIELRFPTLRRARRILDGESVEYARRIVGRHYAPVVAQTAAVGNRTLACGDALDPPLVPGVYQRVVALNLLDSVRDPRQLLAVCDALCEPGGELILSSPYSWQSSIVPEQARLGAADPAAALIAILSTGDQLRAPYEIVDEAELAWPLRRDARSEVTYRIHYLRARKGS
jgi:SAM-dependent methyltransferase